MAMVGAERTKTLVMLVPKRMRVRLRRASGKHGELVPAMPFGDPRRLITEAFGKLHTLYDLGRGGAARECNARFFGNPP
jgi:hypothetical protein